MKPEICKFSSMMQCATFTGIPVKVLKDAKSAGCVAFDERNRVWLGPLLKFLFARKDDGEPDWGSELRRWQAKRMELAAQESSGDLVKIKAVAETILDIGSKTKSLIRQKLENEFPAQLAGCTVAEARVMGKQLADALIKEYQSFAERWTG